MKYYRVVYGYGKDDFYSVPETDVAKALRAQVNGTVFICDEGSIAGNSIQAIRPDYNRLMGYKRDYSLSGEDYDAIGAQAVKEHRKFLVDTKLTALGAGSVKQLSHG